MKLYADNRCHTKPCTFAKGDVVPKLNKLTPTYNLEPYRITHKKRSMITESRPDHAVTGIRLISKECPVKLQTTTIRVKLNTLNRNNMNYRLSILLLGAARPSTAYSRPSRAPRVPPDPVPPIADPVVLLGCRQTQYRP